MGAIEKGLPNRGKTTRLGGLEHTNDIHVLRHIYLDVLYYDNKKHARPHIHAEYGDQVASIAIDDGEVLSGSLPPSKMKLVQAWIEIHKEDLMANWKLAVAGEPVFKIDPLR